jgi:hypothetical protein
VEAISVRLIHKKKIQFTFYIVLFSRYKKTVFLIVQVANIRAVPVLFAKVV